MSQRNTPHELYIEQVKADEKKKKRKYLLLLLLLLLLGSVGVGGLLTLIRDNQGLEYRTFNKTHLDADKVKGILADKNVRIRILDYERGRLDTINTFEEYRQLYGDGIGDTEIAIDTENDTLIDFSRDPLGSQTDGLTDDNPISRRSDVDESSGNTQFVKNSGPLKSFKLDIIGKRVAGEILSFIITDYNPNIRYNLDFGNGVVQDAKEITLYMYPSSGRFTLNLTATDPQFNRSKTNEYIEIKEKNPTRLVEDNSGSQVDTNPTTSDWVIVDNDQGQDNTNTNTTQQDESPDGSGDTGNEQLDNASATSGTSDEVEQPRSTTPTEQVDTKTAPDFDASKIKEPLTTAQKAPSFPGGTRSMYSFLNQHISYPQQARDFEVEGKVYVQFEVDRGGIIKNAKVVKKLGYGCDEEALRIVKLMPRWEPARHMNQVVPYLYTLPVTFRLID